MGNPAVNAIALADHSPGDLSAEACADCARLRGCAGCFEELVRRFQTPLLHFLIRRLGSRHDAEDAVQETFLLAYRNLARYQSSWRFSTWIFTIANRQAVSRSRKRKPPAKVANKTLRDVEGDDPSAIAQVNEARDGLWDAARKSLDADAFTALWLSYVESMSADEISLVLGRSANAVRILLHRARGRLAVELKSV
jgi:RNA polymerase sigma-70 factor (ECF subfamily)